MGVDTGKKPKPTPPSATDDTSDHTQQESPSSGMEGDLGTDVSRRTDQTSVSIPEDGTPVTINTKRLRQNREKERGGTLTRGSNKSQTSLLIEYFEGGKGPNVNSRPSVRVKVTPSAARKIKDANEHIQVTESKGSRKPSYTRRISLGPGEDKHITESADDKSTSSYTSAAEESSLAHRYAPVEIEVLHQDQDSDLSGTKERAVQYNMSDISSMPPDSTLESKAGSLTPTRTRSRSVSGDAAATATNTLKTPSRKRSRSLSKERLAHKAMEKLVSRPRESSSGKHRRSSKHSSRSVSAEQLETVSSPRRGSSKRREESDLTSGAESSLPTNSQLSPRRRSGDQSSFRSGTSKSSINANPRLLETVENAIRRLMPELEILKQEQKMQKSRRRFEQDSMASNSSISRGEPSRKLSKHASAPDVSGKPKVVLNRDEHNAGTVLSGDSVKGRKESRRTRKSDSPSERRSEREMSEETVIHDGEKPSRKRSKDGHRSRDTAAGGIAAGVLTAAALNHHDLKHRDSRSSADRKERRRRRSKSHSRSGSLVESNEDVFTKHDVPPMPMRSDIHSSDITRDSILSERTEEPSTPASDRRRAEIRQVSRGSPREVRSPASRTPTRTPVDLHKGLGTHHSNISRGDLSEHSAHSDRSLRNEDHHSKAAGRGAPQAVASPGALAVHQNPDHQDNEHEYAYHHDSRGLSPIQSVSSRQESETNRHSLGHQYSYGSLSSPKQHRKKSGTSIKSTSSAASINLARSNRPKGINLEPGEDVLDQHRLRDSANFEGDFSDRDPATDEWFQREHEKNDRYRDSIGDSSYRDSTIEYRHMTNYTDDSGDTPYLDRVTAAQELLGGGVGRNPDYRSTPVAVESAVASLHDPSVLSVHSKNEGKSYTDSYNGERMGDSAYVEDLPRDGHKTPADQQQNKAASQTPYTYDQQSAKGSPRQSIARSLDEDSEHIPMGASGLPVPDDPIPEIGHNLNSDSEISTNPSIIQGPMGGTQTGSRDHWPYQPTPPQPKGELLTQSKDSSAHASLKAAAAGFLSTAALANQDKELRDDGNKSRDLSVKDGYQPQLEVEHSADNEFGLTRDSYMSGQKIPSPPKDESYISGPQKGLSSPELAFRNAKSFGDGEIADLNVDDDPFVGSGHTRHWSTNSGLAHGMGSPMYDSATGGGMDRIQSKDIVALMDHLTVRDAQRNARDTEILVTLVRSAAEMRNSFEEMKKFIAEQDDILVDAGNKQHDRTVQKIALGGPRPQPPGARQIPRRTSAEDDGDDTPAKRRNVFRRALKGLSSRNQNDIGKIEDMLVQLLGEVEGLKATQDERAGVASARADGLNTYNNLHAAAPDGFEPEGRAGTGSTGQSGYFSNPPSRGPSAMRGIDIRQGSQNRVSTVLEADEELEAHEQEVLDHEFEQNEQLLTPTKERPRAGSVPLLTPPQMQLPAGTQSNENTPKASTDKSRKHKSSSSSFFPKISRWSKTTASSMGENFRSSGRRERPYLEASRSGSDLQNYDTQDHYDPKGEDRLRSNGSLENDTAGVEDRPPSPLIPSLVSEDPKYQAHRNSVNLQHPQPRPGPSQRYQRQLESQAHNFGSRSPISPTSDTFGSDPALARYIPAPGQRYSGTIGNLSPISDAGYSETSAAEKAAAPPRPPKIKDDGPLIPSVAGPSRPPKLVAKDNRPAFASPLSNEHLQPEQRYSNGSSGYDHTQDSPRSASGAAPSRKPTGPRPITSSGSYSPGKDGVRRTRYAGSPNHIESPTEDVTF